MVKIKTFGTELTPFGNQDFSGIDDMLNSFITENNVQRVISVSDSAVTNERGETVGLIRVLCYEI